MFFPDDDGGFYEKLQQPAKVRGFSLLIAYSFLNSENVDSVYVAVLLLPLSARAAGFPAYAGAAFKAAQEEGKAILVWVHAEW